MILLKIMERVIQIVIEEVRVEKKNCKKFQSKMAWFN